MKSIRDLKKIAGKTFWVRGDLNVPLDGQRITDLERIERFLPTVRYLKDNGGKVIIASHLGRPEGRIDDKFSMKPIRDYMAQEFPLTLWTLGEPYPALQNGEVIMLENLRFDPREEKNDPEFAQKLAQGVDYYINDAFSVSHRAHASVEAIAHILPAYAGFLMEEELSHLAKIMDHPKRPLVAIVGGAKISTKLDLLQNLLDKVDFLIIGGAMANTFLLAQGVDVGKSLVEEDLVGTALAILKKSEGKIILPCDVVVAKGFESPPRCVEFGINSDSSHPELVSGSSLKFNEILKQVQDDKLLISEESKPQPSLINSDEMILDAGPKSVEQIISVLEKAKTVLINGPLGVFEKPPFDKGTIQVFRKIAELTQKGQLTSVAGGGDTVSAIKHAGVYEDLSYVSTAGGAFLEYIEGRTLPGVAALGA